MDASSDEADEDELEVDEEANADEDDEEEVGGGVGVGVPPVVGLLLLEFRPPTSADQMRVVVGPDGRARGAKNGATAKDQFAMWPTTNPRARRR